MPSITNKVIMLSLANKVVMLSVIMLSVVMPNVVAPIREIHFLSRRVSSPANP
jgi:hypothetical protein